MRLDFITIGTDDLDNSIQFYHDVLGFQAERRLFTATSPKLCATTM